MRCACFLLVCLLDFTVDCICCVRTVIQLLTGDFVLNWCKRLQCKICLELEVTLCGLRDVKIQEPTFLSTASLTTTQAPWQSGAPIPPSPLTVVTGCLDSLEMNPKHFATVTV